MSKKQYIIALDIGTTATKGILYDIGGNIVLSASHNYPCYYPSTDTVEQDPDEVLSAVVTVIRTLVKDSRINSSSVTALVFGGILHSLLPVDREGKMLCRALTWADRRSSRQSERLRSELDIEDVRSRTGCTIHPLYFLPRLAWFREMTPDISGKVFKFVSIKEYILNHFFGDYIVDRSIASGTGIWNMHTMNWDADLLSIVGVDTGQLSQVVQTTWGLDGLRQEYASRMGLIQGTPGIIGGADGPLAHLGSVGLDDTRLSLTVGTTGALRRNLSSPMVIPGVEAWCYYLTENNWVLGGVVHDAGIVMKWLSDNFIQHGRQDEDVFDVLNRSVETIPPGSDGLLFFPYMSGERSPRYNPSARAALIGMTLSHGREHVVRALIEGIAYRLHSVYRMLTAGKDMECVVTGGILKSRVWLKIIADFFGMKLWKPGVQEAAAWGAVLIALRALKIIDRTEKMNDYVRTGECVDFNPEAHHHYQKIRSLYDEYYNRLYK